MDTVQPDGRPRAAFGPNGRPEQIVVNKSMGGPIWDIMRNGGVSTYPGHEPTYNDQWLSGDQDKGLFFQHSWDAALAHPAPMLLVTGWNEWKATIWDGAGVPMLGRKLTSGQGLLIDEFNMDFNRDIEPMRGWYGDNYYWQFLANMRMYKGVQAPQAVSPPKQIDVDGPISQWDGVTPVFTSAQGRTTNRDWPGTVPGTHYTDASARNEVVLAQCARDDLNIYFHAQTSAPITGPQSRNWMLLLVHTGNDAHPGWNGYDLLIDRDRIGDACTIEQNVGGTWNWNPVGRARFSIQGKDFVVAVPLPFIVGDIQKRPLAIGFKWADNLPETPDVYDFYTTGSVAPDARFNFSYIVPPAPSIPPPPTTPVPGAQPLQPVTPPTGNR
jgi:hypothetical protein